METINWTLLLLLFQYRYWLSFFIHAIPEVNATQSRTFEDNWQSPLNVTMRVNVRKMHRITLGLLTLMECIFIKFKGTVPRFNKWMLKLLIIKMGSLSNNFSKSTLFQKSRCFQKQDNSLPYSGFKLASVYRYAIVYMHSLLWSVHL